MRIYNTGSNKNAPIYTKRFKLNNSMWNTSMPHRQPNLIKKSSGGWWNSTAGDIVRFSFFGGGVGTLIGACITGGSVCSLFIGLIGAAVGAILGQEDIPGDKDRFN